MAYKFQLGAAILSGSVKAEDGLNAGTSGLADAGAIAGATTITATGVADVGSITIDTDATIGCNGDGDIITLGAQEVSFADDVDVIIGKVGGFMYGAGAVTATHAELNYLDIATLGTAAASKALTIKGDSTWTVAGMTCADIGTITTADINGGTVDGATIGVANHTSGKFTTCDATTDFTIDGLVITADTITNDAVLTVVSTGLTLNASLDIALSADGGNVTMDDGTTTIFDFDVDGTALTIHDDQDTGDKVVMTMAQHGAFSIVTTDDDAAAANITITADGTAELAGTTVTLSSSAGVTIDADNGTITFSDDGVSLGTITSAGWTGAVVGNASTATKIASITNSNIVQLTETQTLTNKTLTAPTLTTPVLGTPASGVLTNCTALPAAQVAQGTMASGMVLVAPALGTPASGVLTNCTALPAAQVAQGTMASGMILVAPALGTPASGVLTNCTALPAAQVAQGTMASGMVLVAPALGTPASGVLTNCTGTASSLTAGNATVAALATLATVSDSTANTDFPVVFNNESNALLDDTGAFEYNPSSGTLTATTFTGALSGNSTTSTTTTNITVADSTDTTCYVGLWESVTGAQAPKSDAGLTYNAGTGMLTATGLTGPLTGNASGTALSVTQAAQTTITSLGTLTGLSIDGDVTFVGEGANAVWDTSEDGFSFQDDAAIFMGTGGDMSLLHDGTNSYITNAVGALKIATETSGIAVTIGHGTSEVTVGDNLTVTGNLTVQGATTSVSSTTVNISSSFTFEGPADAYETIFHAGTPTADLTVYLPQFSASAGTQSFYIPALIDAPTDASSKVTAAEFALLDGGTSRVTPTLLDNDGFLCNDGGTMKQVEVVQISNLIMGKFQGDATVGGDGTLTLGNNVVESGMLNNNIISGLTDIGAAITSTDELLISDNGTIRRTDMSRLTTFLADTSATVNGRGDAAVTLEAGVNYATANMTASRVWSLPASAGMSVGQSVKVKAAGVGGGSNPIVITKVGSQTIDNDLTSISLESDYAAVELIYVAADKWRVF